MQKVEKFGKIRKGW